MAKTVRDSVCLSLGALELSPGRKIRTARNFGIFREFLNFRAGGQLDSAEGQIVSSAGRPDVRLPKSVRMPDSRPNGNRPTFAIELQLYLATVV